MRYENFLQCKTVYGQFPVLMKTLLYGTTGFPMQLFVHIYISNRHHLS